ncbi:hypothetical protein [Shewanella sp. AC91-MNA-CIBAN-0169]|uniref:hypothetical protein n=1 Tax=Shewanella sp. AC91-MNA-CIBAN-0169 TaxID=3140466 RepID=UPI003321C40B
MEFTQQNNNESSKKIPFIIGISGHRDVIGLTKDSKSGLEGVKKAIKSCLLYWRTQLNDTTPIWLLSGMAEGADLLAVEAANELINEGWQSEQLIIIPCLPMLISAYETDFAEPLHERQFGLEGFRRLFDKHKNEHLIIESGLTIERYRSAMADLNYGEDRCSLYLNLGAFLSKYANVIIALWDGHASEGIGGTADVVSIKLGQKIDWPKGTDHSALLPMNDFDGGTGGVIQHIPVLRLIESTKPIISSCFTKLEETAIDSPFSIYITNNLNVKKHPAIQKYLSAQFIQLMSQLQFYNTELMDEIPSQQLEQTQAGLGYSASLFNTADYNAGKFQSKYRNIMTLFFVISLLGLFFYEFLGSYVGKQIGMVLNVLILLSISLCYYLIYYSATKQLKWKYQIYRGIAECFRIRGFLNLADIAPNNKPLVPRRYQETLPLFNQAIALAELDWWRSRKPVCYERIRIDWLENQNDFLKKNLNIEKSFWPFKTFIFNRPKLAHKDISLVSRILFLLAIFSGICLLITQFTFSLHIQSWTMIIVQILVMLAGVTALWCELAGYQSTATGYENLSKLYERAVSIIAENDKNSIDYCLREIANEAIIEHCEWSHYEGLSDLKVRR